MSTEEKKVAQKKAPKPKRRTLLELLSSVEMASPDAPIFTRGFVIGGRYPRRTKPRRTPEQKPEGEKKPGS